VRRESLFTHPTQSPCAILIWKAAAAAHGGGPGLRRVGARRRLGDGERLQAKASGGNVGQVLLLLLVRAVPQQRAHDVHLRVARAGVGAGAIDLLEDDRGFGHAQPASTVLGRNQCGQPAGVAEGVDERLWILGAFFDRAPILVAERGAQFSNGAAIVLEVSSPWVDVSRHDWLASHA